MNWKKAYRSFYYRGAPEPEDIILEAAETVLLVIDIQNKYMQDPDDPDETHDEGAAEDDGGGEE